MKDKYKTYDNQYFEYYYPTTWKRRNIDYLKKRNNREIQKYRCISPKLKG